MNKKQVVKALLSQFTFHKSSLEWNPDKKCIYIPDKMIGLVVGYPGKDDVYIASINKGSTGQYFFLNEQLRLSWWESRKARAIYNGVLRRKFEEQEMAKYTNLLKQAGLGVLKDE